jgi:hypothetical protein
MKLCSLMVLVPLAGCGGSGRVVIAEKQAAVVRLLASDTRLFWLSVDATSGVGRVVSAPLAGGAPTVLADGQAFPVDMALTQTAVYWTTDDGHIRSVPVGGGSMTEVSAASHPFAIAALRNGGDDDDSVFWLDRSGAGSPAVLVEITTQPGWAPVNLAVGLHDPSALRVDAQAFYWADSDGHIYRRARGGSVGTPIEAIVDGQNLNAITGAPLDVRLAVDASHAYWYDGNSDSVRAAPLAGGASSALYRHAGFPCDAPVVDGASLYCADPVEVERVPLGGGAAVTAYASDGRSPGLVAIAGANLVFTESGSDGDIVARVAK